MIVLWESEGVGVFYIVAFEQILVCMLHASIIVNNSKSDNAVNNIPGLNRTTPPHLGHGCYSRFVYEAIISTNHKQTCTTHR